MKHIYLTQGKSALVDDSDYDELSAYSWSYSKKYGKQAGDQGYASRSIYLGPRRYKTEFLHNHIMGKPPIPGMQVDHRDRNTLNCRRSNLRFVTRRTQQLNRGLYRRNNSGYRGVTRASGKWVANIRVNSQQYYLGRYSDKKIAGMAYDVAAIYYNGAEAQLNFP